MKKLYKYSIFCVLLALTACDKDKLLDVESQTILTDEQVWGDPKLITSVLANYYGTLENDHQAHKDQGTNGTYFATFDEAMWSGLGNAVPEGQNNILNYPFDNWRVYNYSFVRSLNLAIIEIGKNTSAKLTPAIKTQFISELRFIRAYHYFEMVKRMGGVPIITDLLIYDFSGDPTYLQRPRNKESEVYDFIASEVDAIKETLGNTASTTRANKYTALALKCRAMLYAGSIAKYNNRAGFTPITTANGEVGIPLSLAAGYYQKALDAAKEILNSGQYALYNGNPSDKADNFYQAFINKTAANKEVIWATDYLKAKGRFHLFTYSNIPRSLREDATGSSNMVPSLGLVEDFQYLDGSIGALKGIGTGSNTAAGQTWIFYTNPQDIFANKDARLAGTVIYPGSSFAGKPVEMQTGVYVWNAAANKYDRIEGTAIGTKHTDGKLLTGANGPMRTTLEVSNTGFYMRKYLDPAPGASTLSGGSDVWWVLFRLGEIYLNAGEAAFELGLTNEALTYFNAIRTRAGFTGTGLFTAATLTLDQIQRERRVELAFEDHRLWDLKRWRIAHEVWSGQPFNTNPKAWITGLFPYRIIRPGHPDDGKYVFDKFVPDRFKQPRFFQLGNYYSQIDQGVINNNPLIVRNPFH